MATLNPYLSFNGNCREVMHFYQACLGGELSLQTIGESPLGEHFPADRQDKILHATLIKEGIFLMGSDMPGPGGFVQGNTFTLSLNCTTEAEINLFYTNLGIGGQILDSLKVQFWGAMFGVLIDKYGVKWMFNYDQNAQ